MGDSNWFQRLTGWLSKKQEQKEPLTGSSSAMPASPKRKSNRKVTVLFVLGVVGILLILLSECNGRQTAAQPTDTTVPKVETEQLETKLKTLVQTITGDPKPQVMVSFSDNGESVYEYDTKTSSEEESGQSEANSRKKTSERSIIYVKDGNGGQTARVRQYRLAKPEGVVVACQNGEDITVKSRLIHAISTVLGIPTSSVYITERAGTS